MNKITKIKICGITREQDLNCVMDAGVDAVGFVFYSASPRYVTPEKAAMLLATMRPFVTTVGLFVNASVQQVQQVLAIAPVHLLQFHGDETPEQCHAIAEAVNRP
ncbi:MAG: N-(5'-phosphoribosyl)anthranilate isomerase, partial [Undibacterium sp.]|nr:N-(5'-phosphoribosyl)anthranilate isomerase [Undibacterium sp.]